jgi:hypothetical protein
LFRGSARENIAVGRPIADSDIVTASMEVGTHDRLAGAAEGYDAAPAARNWQYFAWSHSSVTEEDQLALDAGALKFCPLLGEQRPFLHFGRRWL